MTREQLINDLKAHTQDNITKECISLLEDTEFSTDDIKAIWKGRV